MDLSMLSGPIIGALIGYGTNWIAIKMLFRPLKPVKIGKYTLPFTPGIIPKRKEKLAGAIGQMVGNNLFTTNDIKDMLLSESLQETVISGISQKLESENDIKNVLSQIVNEEMYANGKEFLKLFISEKIKDSLLKANIGEIIANEGGQVVRTKVNGTMLKMFVTDGLIDSIVGPMGSEVEKYIQEHGQEKIIPIVEQEISDFETSSIKDFMGNLDLDDKKIKEIIKQIYTNFVLNNVNVLLGNIDISGVVEEKVNKMEVLELEKLLLSVMKKELSAIVNLGALIGLILGTLNIFI